MKGVSRFYRGLLLPLIVAGSFTQGGIASEFRSRIPIRTPARPPEGAVRVSTVQPVDPRLVEDAVRKLYAAYGYSTGAIAGMLAPSFPDRSRLLNTINQRVPRDARLRVLGIQSIRTLDQFLRTDAASGAEERVSTVTATVRSQLEYNDRDVGFQRLEGTIEYLFRVKQKTHRQR